MRNQDKEKEPLLAKNWKRDFGIGMAAGAVGTLASLPFDKIVDPITAKNYHDAVKVEVTPEVEKHLSKTNPKLLSRTLQEAATTQTSKALIDGKEVDLTFASPGKKILNRGFGRYVADQTRTTFWKDPYTGKMTGELKTLPLKMLEKGTVFGTSMLATGALYRALKDTNPMEKQSSLQLIGYIFNETTRNISR